MKYLAFFIYLIIALFACKETPLQRADIDFDVSVQKPSFANRRPIFLFDEGHNNFHTTNGLYLPFSNLMKNDGYELKTHTTNVMAESLSPVDIYVIANAKGTGHLNDTPAFTEEECDIIEAWVVQGGSLLLIADHFPFGDATENLANRFNINFQKGMVQDSVHYDKNSKDQSQLEFSKENGLLAEHPITSEVNKVITFTGQSIQCQNSLSTSLLMMSEGAYDMTPTTKVIKDGDDTRVEVNYENLESAKGRSQGIAMYFGKGKVVCLGEAAMLTAQLDRENNKVGMNYNLDNKRFALNIMRWLATNEKR